MAKSAIGLERKIKSKQAVVAVVGLGYVGLPLAVEFACRGFTVQGIETDKDRLRQLKKRISYIKDVSSRRLRKVSAAGRFIPQGDFSCLRDSDAVIICVPTPLKRRYSPDISFITGAVRQIKGYLQKGQLIVLESTTYPGTTEEVIIPLLQKSGLRCGKDFYLAFSPERLDPGNEVFPVRKIPKIIGGTSAEATRLAALLYQNIVDKVVEVSSARVAETAKLLENTFRIVNIGLIDELAMMAHKMNIDIWEVIEAAKTKPFGFMPFYPGPGVGGHCLAKDETLLVRSADSLKVMPIGDLIPYLKGSHSSDVQVVSFDPLRQRSVFKKVTLASARPYSKELLKITTEDGRSIKVTDQHPMFVCNNNRWGLKYARDLRKGDLLPAFLGLPDFADSRLPGGEVSRGGCIDLLREINSRGSHLINQVRVKPVGFSWRDFSAEIKQVSPPGKYVLPAGKENNLSDEYLPLKYFYLLEEKAVIDHAKLLLVTARGQCPALIEIDEDFCRLIGYYLSRGRYVKAVSFTFERREKEAIAEVAALVARLGLRSCLYNSQAGNTIYLKVPSDIFAFLIDEVLSCGRDCRHRQVPESFFSLSKEMKQALISGIYRGGGCLKHRLGRRIYPREEKYYFSCLDATEISFSTLSSKLFHQLTLLLHDLGIVPTFGRGGYRIAIAGDEQLNFFKDLLAGEKSRILQSCLALKKGRRLAKSFRKFKNFAALRVNSIVPQKAGWVYSLETEKPHSFVTSYGIVVHNCIPKDPLYLYWKAKRFGFHSRFIRLASDIVTRMPEYVVDRLNEALQGKGVELSKAKILIVGVTYKKDVKDLRRSPALDMIDRLRAKGSKVSYYDPLIPYLRINHLNLNSLALSAKGLASFDCAVIATGHSAVDYGFILEHSRLVFDTRNVYASAKNDKLIRL